MNKLYDESSIQNIADAIREKSGKTDTMTVKEMCEEVDDLITLSQYLNTNIIDVVDRIGTKLPSYAFYNFSNLVSFRGEKIEVINIGAMNGCSSLKQVTLPSVQTLWGGFQNCTSLVALILPNSTMASNRSSSYVLTGSAIAKGNGYIYVPSALIEQYKTATNWATFANQFRELEKYTVDGTTTGSLKEGLW